MKTKHFTELEVWQKAMNLTAKIFKYVENLEEGFYRNELSKAALIISTKIAAASAFEDIEEQIQKFNLSISACIAVENMTYIMRELELMDQATAEELKSHAVEIKETLLSFTEMVEEGYVEED